MDRAILHCDLNSFFASVEEVRNPELRAFPVAVCGNPNHRHGIILAKNEKAKAFGVKTAETLWQARRKCPELVLVPPHYEEYSRYSKIVNEIYLRYTDLVEPFGIDESWLDVTGSLHLFGSPREIADDIRKTILKETGLTVSVGVSFTKSFAKLGSDYKKPNATTEITRENFRNIVWPLPVSDLLFVGRSSRETFNRLGIETIGDLARSSREMISAHLGKSGELVYDYANGIDSSPVQSAFEETSPKSIGRGLTYSHDLTDISEIKTALLALSDDVAQRLRRHKMCALAVSLTVRDPAFKTSSRQKTLSSPTHLSSEISKACFELYEKYYLKAHAPVRMLTVTALSLIDEELASSSQISLFADNENTLKRESVELTLDEIRKKFGRDATTPASLLNGEFGMLKKDEK